MTGKLQPSHRRLRIDHTHMGRRSTGIERITRELFSASALSSLPVEPVDASRGRLGVVMAQNVTLPLNALRHRTMCSCFRVSRRLPIFRYHAAIVR